MKMIAFVLVSLAAVSSQAGMGDFETRITCPAGQSQKVVSDLAASAKQDSFAKGLLMSAKTLKKDLRKLMNDADTREAAQSSDVQEKVTQAACLIEYLSHANVLVNVDTYADNLKLIELNVRINANKSPMVAQTQGQKNAEIVDAIFSSNQTTIASLFSIVD